MFTLMSPIEVVEQEHEAVTRDLSKCEGIHVSALQGVYIRL